MANNVATVNDGIMELINDVMDHIADANEIEELAKNNDYDVDTLKRWQTLKAGSLGFLSGIPGGLLAVPAAFADISATLYNQVRMVAGIAYIRGYDVNSENVKCLIMACLVGEKVIGNMVKKAATEMLTTAIENYIKRKTAKTVYQKFAEKLGFRIATKSAASGLRHIVPLLGGLVSGSYDALSTRAVGELADKMFPAKVVPAYAA